MAPWSGPRYRSWASNANLSGLFAAVIFATYVIWEAFGTAPLALVNLLGPTVGVWFAAVASDAHRRVQDTEDKADRATVDAAAANAKADRLTEDAAGRADRAAKRRARRVPHGEEDVP